MLIASVFLLAVEVIGGSGMGPPDVKDFKSVLSKELEFRTDDYKIGFVGQVIVYQNPNDPNEFVRVYYRQVALVSERAKEKDTSEVNGRDGNSSDINYHKKQEAEALIRVQQAVDAFAYVQWRTVRDPRTGQDIQTGPMQIWLLDQNGAYAYYSQPEDAEENALKYSPFSESSEADPDKSVMVGLKFTLGDAVHIVRVDQDDISALGKSFDDIQSKEADNGKK